MSRVHERPHERLHEPLHLPLSLQVARAARRACAILHRRPGGHAPAPARQVLGQAEGLVRDLRGLAVMLATPLSMGLAGCGSQPPAPESPAAVPRPAPAAAAPSRSDGIDAFERQHRERAETAQRQGRLADAALSWEVLAALKPQRSEYRERLAATRAQIQAALEERIGKAAAAHKRGELEAAVQHYLAALALEPTHDGAADALRLIERERQKRQIGRLARDPLQRRSNGEMDPRTPPASPPPATRGLARPASATGDKAARPAQAASSSR